MTIIWAFQSVTDKDFVKEKKKVERWTSNFFYKGNGMLKMKTWFPIVTISIITARDSIT